MSGNWSNALRRFRLRHGLSQKALAGLLAISPRRLAALEHGVVAPTPEQEAQLRDLTRALPSELLAGLAGSIRLTRLPRALSRGPTLQLKALSKPAIVKRPSIVDWIGRDLTPLACGVLQDMLDDRELQRAILRGEVAGVVTTSRGVLRTPEAEQIGSFRTTISYFFHDGTLYSDAIAVPVSPEERIGWTPILPDELGADLFGDSMAIEVGLGAPKKRRTGK